MLAWIFWHSRSLGVDEAEYRVRLEAFHERIAEAAPDGYLGSRVLFYSALPWLPSPVEVFEDWYFLRSAAALDALDEAAVTPHVHDAHASASRLAATAVSGLYRLRAGAPAPHVRHVSWITKPRGEPYDAFIGRSGRAAAVWSRKMVLGPAPEFCLETTASARPNAAPDTLVFEAGRVLDLSAMNSEETEDMR